MSLPAGLVVQALARPVHQHERRNRPLYTCSPPDVYPQDANSDVFPRDANLGVGGVF